MTKGSINLILTIILVVLSVGIGIFLFQKYSGNINELEQPIPQSESSSHDDNGRDVNHNGGVTQDSEDVGDDSNNDEPTPPQNDTQPLPDKPTPLPLAETLRSLADVKGMKIGTSILPYPNQPLRDVNDPLYRETVAREYNIISAENGGVSLSDEIRPCPSCYNLESFDYLIDFAEANNMKVHAGHLLWNTPYAFGEQPSWVAEGDFNRDELIAILKEHIQTIVGKYKNRNPGTIYFWTVENEAIKEDGTLYNSIFLRGIGQEYIDMAFQFAREADPNAVLIYNGGSMGMEKGDKVYQFIKSMVDRGVQIDGVGIQDHIDLGRDSSADPSFYLRTDILEADLDRTLALYSGLNDLGLRVFITEMDITVVRLSGTESEKFAAQAAIYGNKLKACILASNCDTFISWGFTDKHTWLDQALNYLPGKKKPLIFDVNYNKKPAYDSLKALLK